MGMFLAYWGNRALLGLAGVVLRHCSSASPKLYVKFLELKFDLQARNNWYSYRLYGRDETTKKGW